MAGNRKMLRLLAGGAVAAVAGWTFRDTPAQLGGRVGGRAVGTRAERMRRSPQFSGKAFRNPVPPDVVPPGTMAAVMRELVLGRERRRPSGAVPLCTPDHTGPPSDGVGVLWYGHATVLAEIEGRRVLFDPLWSDRTSPVPFAGPRRLHPLPAPIESLPPVDAIVISHDHYDHLDLATVRALTRLQSAPFLVPLGIGAHLERWRVPAERIIELDWEEEAQVAGLRFVATAARHFSGRTLRRNDTLWSSWVVAGRERKVFFGGDSGYWNGYETIGSAHGPFDLTIMPIGAYSPAWPDVHMNPEQAVAAHIDLGGSLLLPIHWATYDLATHSWVEPADRLWREAKARDARIVVPRVGQRIDVAEPPAVDGWWQTLAPAR